METVTSRKNAYIVHLRRLTADGEYRRMSGEYLCDGMKTLREALTFGAEITSVLWKERAQEVCGLACSRQTVAPAELFDYASFVKNSPGPLFTVRIPAEDRDGRLQNAIVLESVQDPGNVGTVIRTANAFGIGAVVLTGECAELYNPKTVRATMGAIFRERVVCLPLAQLGSFLREHGLPLYGAALSEKAEDIRGLNVRSCAVAVGSEGRGLSTELRAMCEGELIIPMQPCSESLNAGVAASVIMWEMAR